MGLPTSREETAVNGVPINPNTINAIQDAIIGLNALAAGVGWVSVSPAGSERSTNLVPNLLLGNFSPDDMSGVTGFHTHLRIPDGAAIDGIRVHLFGDGDVEVVAGITQYHDGVRTLVGDQAPATLPPMNISEDSVPAAWTTYTAMFTAPHVVNNANGVYYIEVGLYNWTALSTKIESVSYHLTVP